MYIPTHLHRSLHVIEDTFAVPEPRKHTEEIRGTTPVNKSKLQLCTICAALLRPVHRHSAVQESDDITP